VNHVGGAIGGQRRRTNGINVLMRAHWRWRRAHVGGVRANDELRQRHRMAIWTMRVS
jgi:hypothetical protein